MVSDIRSLIEIESPSSDPAALAVSARAVQALIEARWGRPCRLSVVDGISHVIAPMSTGPTRVLLLAHHDTVWPHGTLARLPSSQTEGVLRGPGCFDMLTGLVMAIHAAAMVQEQCGTAAVQGLTLVVTGDEEVGSGTSRELILQQAEGAEAVLVLEAAGEGGAIKLARKGASKYRLRCHGRAAHAGLEPERGVSAVLELVAQVPRVVALADLEAGTTVTPTTLSGGNSSNTVPDLAELDIDVRARTADELRRVDGGLRGLRATHPDAAVELLGDINRWPMEREHSAELWSLYQESCARLDVAVPPGIAVGGASDGNFTAAAGVPTLDGLGAVGGGAHAEDEHALIDQIAPRTAVLSDLICGLLGLRESDVQR